MFKESFLLVRILVVFFSDGHEGEADCKGKPSIVDDSVEPIDGITCLKEVYSIYMYGYHAYQHCHTEEVGKTGIALEFGEHTWHVQYHNQNGEVCQVAEYLKQEAEEFPVEQIKKEVENPLDQARHEEAPLQKQVGDIDKGDDVAEQVYPAYAPWHGVESVVFVEGYVA